MNSTILFIGEYQAVLCEAKWIDTKVTIKSLASSILPINMYITDIQKQYDEVVKVITDLVKTSEVKSDSIIVVVPDAYTFTRVLEMPFLTEAELISSIRYQADQFIPLPIQEVNIDIEILSSDKKNSKLQVLFSAASKADILKLQNIFSSSGLSPELLFPQQVSFKDILEKLNMNFPDTIYINLGLTSCTFTYFSKLPQNVFEVHTVKYGIDLIAKDIQLNFSIPYMNALNILHTSFSTIGNTTSELQKIIELPLKELINHAVQFSTAIESKYGNKIKNIYFHGESSTNLELIQMMQNIQPNYTIQPFVIKVDIENKKENIISLYNKIFPMVNTLLGSAVT